METAELLKKIRLLEITTKGLTRHIFSGQYHSAFKGRGMAFSEVREYQIGDEVRTIDWNVTARFNDPYVKVFEEERELTVMLMIDVSGSSNVGTSQRSKKELALEIAALLAFSAVSNNDKVGAIFISEKVEKYIAPQKGRNHALLILRELIEHKPQQTGTNLAEGIRYFSNTEKKRSIAFVISDFKDQHNYLHALKVARKRHDMVAIELYDRADLEVPDLGIIPIFDSESGERVWVNTSDRKYRESVRQTNEQQLENRMKEFRRSGIDIIRIGTDEDIVKPLIKLFKER